MERVVDFKIEVLDCTNMDHVAIKEKAANTQKSQEMAIDNKFNTLISVLFNLFFYRLALRRRT